MPGARGQRPRCSTHLGMVEPDTGFWLRKRACGCSTIAVCLYPEVIGDHQRAPFQPQERHIFMQIATSQRCVEQRGQSPRVGGLQPASTLKPDEPRLALFRTIDPRAPLTSNIKLHTSNFSCLYASPYYPPCCRNLSKKWIAPPSEIAVSPCPDANKENLSAGRF